MNPDTIPQLSLGTAVLLIFLVCAGFVMLRGMARMLGATVVLATSAWLAFAVWQRAPTLSFEWFGRSLGWVTTGLPFATFLSSWWLIRRAARAVAAPLATPSEERIPPARSASRSAFLMLLALIPTALLCLIGAVFIHHAGSIAEVRAFSEQSVGITEPTPAKFSQRLKASIAAALPEDWLRFLDPLAEPSRLNLAKIVTAQSEAPLQPVIDPRTGEPIPRAIIVDDPELQTLAREGKFGTLLRHPLLTKALNDPKVKALLKDLHL